MTEAAARGQRDLFSLDQCGFAPALPLRYTWAREGTRPLARYEAPQGRRVNVLGAYAPFGPPGAHPRFLYESRLASEGKLDGGALLDFICREIAGLDGGYASLDRLAGDPLALAATRPPTATYRPPSCSTTTASTTARSSRPRCPPSRRSASPSPTCPPTARSSTASSPSGTP